jgi:heme exporter protein A
MQVLCETTFQLAKRPAWRAPAVETHALEKVIDERPILRDINLSVPAGQFLALLGANGAGKSTLLKVLATLTPPSGGELWLLGRPSRRDAAGLRARIGLVGHQSMLYRDLSARENLELFARLYGLDHPTDRAWASLQAVGLTARANDPVRAFSRGMTQRISIARALIHDPELVLADEPFAGLDVTATATIESLLREAHEARRTVILVNHDIAQSLRLAERIVVLHEGAVLIDQPADTVTAAEVIQAIEEEARR